MIENAQKDQEEFLAVPSIKDLKAAVQLVIGEPAVRALANNGRMNFYKIFLRLITLDSTSLLERPESSIVLVIFPNPALLKILENNPKIDSILVIPRRFSDIKQWISKWNAVEL